MALYQRENIAIISDLAEVVQILEFPRANPEFAEAVSKAIGGWRTLCFQVQDSMLELSREMKFLEVMTTKDEVEALSPHRNEFHDG